MFDFLFKQIISYKTDVLEEGLIFCAATPAISQHVINESAETAETAESLSIQYQ